MRKPGAVILALLVVGALLYEGAAWQAKRSLIAYVEANCDRCKLEIESIRFSPWRGAFTLVNSSFSWGDPESTAVSIQLPRVTASLDLWKLPGRELRFHQIEATDPQFLITEGPRKLPKGRPGNGEASAWSIAVEGVRIVDASFRYTRTYSEKQAIINVSQIQAKIGPWGTVQDLLGKSTSAQADGVLERSGHFRLRVAKPLQVAAAPLEVNLEIEGQHLEDLNSFFHIDSGIQLEGTVLRGKSNVVVHGKRLTGASEIQYEHFDIHFEKYRDRGAFSALLGNVGKSLTVGHDLPSLLPGELKLTAVELERVKEETIIQFILRGMKDSALKVTALRKPKPSS